MTDDQLSANEAAKSLGISLNSLYSYVSRGLLKSAAGASGKRSRVYSRSEVEKLRLERQLTRHPVETTRSALRWGVPLLESRLTLIEDGQLYYRGLNAVELSRFATCEQVAGLLWSGAKTADYFDEPELAVPKRCRKVLDALGETHPLTACAVILPILARDDAATLDGRPGSSGFAGARLIRIMASVVAGEKNCDGPIAITLARAWRCTKPEDVAHVKAALVLCADHELNVSAFTGRCVASSGAGVIRSVSAALNALHGPRHGGVTERVGAFADEAEAIGIGAEAVRERFRRGEEVAGFGHPLYPSGDPRGAELMRIAGDKNSVMLDAAKCMDDLRGLKPNVDFGLVALARSIGLPKHAPLTLFALGRCIGWVAHAIEEVEQGSLIRPRAKYIGLSPNEEQLFQP